MPSILTKPAQTLSGIPGTYKTGVTASASTTTVLDSVIAVNNYSIKWFVTLIDNTNSNTRECEINAINKFNLSIEHTVSYMFGDFIAHGFDVQLNAGNIELIITNNEINDIDASIIRMQFIHS